MKIEFISFKASELSQQTYKESTNLGIIYLEEDANQLNEVVVRSEKTTVEIKLDKKVAVLFNLSVTTILILLAPEITLPSSKL